jgi:pectate lyase
MWNRPVAQHVGFTALVQESLKMVKYALGAALLLGLTAPALATSSTTTTTTTTGGSSSESFYIIRDPSTKKCTISTTKPTSSTTVVAGDTTYHSRTEAEGAIKTTKVCTES